MLGSRSGSTPTGDVAKGRILRSAGKTRATFTQDVSGATNTSGDPPFCGTWWCVWYSYTPTVDEHGFFDTMGSDYDTALAVYLDLDGFPVDCDEDALGTLQSRVELDVEAGRTYLIQVTAQYRFGPPTPGTLVFNADRITSFTLDLAVDPTAQLESRTAVWVSGTVAPSTPDRALPTAPASRGRCRAMERAASRAWCFPTSTPASSPAEPTSLLPRRAPASTSSPRRPRQAT
jgi:hypothetical protein